ncbi:hypothetical protein D3C73_1538480 [compost metagenome]
MHPAACLLQKRPKSEKVMQQHMQLRPVAGRFDIPYGDTRFIYGIDEPLGALPPDSQPHRSTHP